MAYIVFFIITMILIGSGAIGSDAFLLGIIIGFILICIGISRL